MKFLRRFFVLSAIVLCLSSGLWGCAPSQSAGSPTPSDDRADANSYKALVGPKWCLSSQNTQGLILSWVFRDDGKASYTTTNPETRQTITQPQTWRMRRKTLSIYDERSGTEVIKKEISFALDLNTGIQVMQWAAPSMPSNCVDGSCTSVSTPAMTLTECE